MAGTRLVDERDAPIKVRRGLDHIAAAIDCDVIRSRTE
jgi:hypothetical protein